MTDVKMKLHLCKEPDKFQFVILLNGLHPRKVESVFVISTKDFGLEPKATINRKGKHRENTPLANSTRREHY